MSIIAFLAILIFWLGIKYEMARTDRLEDEVEKLKKQINNLNNRE